LRSGRKHGPKRSNLLGYEDLFVHFDFVEGSEREPWTVHYDICIGFAGVVCTRGERIEADPKRFLNWCDESECVEHDLSISIHVFPILTTDITPLMQVGMQSPEKTKLGFRFEIRRWHHMFARALSSYLVALAYETGV
jgi:hypothetical protein